MPTSSGLTSCFDHVVADDALEFSPSSTTPMGGKAPSSKQMMTTGGSRLEGPSRIRSHYETFWFTVFLLFLLFISYLWMNF
jgi:hypothetical protein